MVKGLIAKHVPYEKALGIKAVTFSPNGQYLSVGSYDQIVKLFVKTKEVNLGIGENI